MNSEKDFEHIERYLNQELDEEAQHAFEAKLAADPNLRQELELYKLSRQGIEKIIEDDLRSDMNNWWEEEQPHKSSRRMLLFVGLIAAIILGMTGWWWFGQKASDQELLEQFYVAPIALNLRLDSDSPLPLQEGMDQYSAGNFEEASTYFSQISPDAETYETARYFQAQSNFRAGNLQASKALFQQIIDASASRYLQDAEWYLLLNYLALGQKEETFHSHY